MTYAVQVRDHASDGNEFALYGPFRSRQLAAEFAQHVCDAIEDWQIANSDEYGPAESDAWAYVIPFQPRRSITAAMTRAGFAAPAVEPRSAE